jgi:N-acetylglucosamine-6-phosphate deacetylase
MLIGNGRVFMPDGVFAPGGVRFGETIEEVGPVEGEGIDAQGGYIVPGFLDIHTHGAMDRDFSDGGEGDIAAAARYYAARGVTGFLATTMTLKEPVLRAAMERVRDLKPTGAAKCLGVNLEGPFLSFAKKGAQNPDNLHKPDAEMFLRLNEASGGNVRLVTVAPEEAGAMDFIRRVSKECTVSLGHTEADYDTAMEAFDAGASHVTHLFNAMPSLLHRAPGLIGAARDAGVTAEIICDGLHVHPSAVRCAHDLFGANLALISDSLRCAGMPDGDYELGGLPIVLSGGVARLRDGTIAGSSISVYHAVKNAVRFGIPLEAAIAAATSVPARAAGLSGSVGSLKPGLRADLLVLDEKLCLKRIFIDGKEYKD